jgi:hypothetical protein
MRAGIGAEGIGSYRPLSDNMLSENEGCRFECSGFSNKKIWNLFGPILRPSGTCNLLFPVYPAWGIN